MRFLVLKFIFAVFLLLNIGFSQAQNDYQDAPFVVLGNKKLFEIKTRTGSIDKNLRAKIISERIKLLADDKTFDTNFIVIKDSPKYSDITDGKNIIMSVTDEDAKKEFQNRKELSQKYTEIIKISIDNYKKMNCLENLLVAILQTFAATVAVYILFRTMGYASSKWVEFLNAPEPKFFVRKIKIFSKQEVISFFTFLAKLLFWIIGIGVIYFYLVFIFKLYPYTADISEELFYQFSSSVDFISVSFTNYLPKLIFILLCLIIVYYINMFIKFMFNRIETGRIKVAGFYREWAEITSKLFRLFVCAIALGIIFPYLPGAETGAFKGVSIFLGVLISLGSSSSLANMITGIILIYTRAFKTGDRLKIGETIGDVIEQTLLVTRIKTIKNEIISVPNSVIIGSHIVNYSSSAQTEGLILHANISIGYSTPWKKVHELLISAALSTEHILSEPSPFVFQAELNDFYVLYKINAYTNHPEKMQNIYSMLYANILDKFNEAQVEIMSPHYSAIRDGNRKEIPDEYLPENYIPSGFKVDK